MRVLLQRARTARVEVAGRVVGELPRPGLVALVGITHTDTAEIVERTAEKVWTLRILDDERSAADVDAPLLVVSQFTLYVDTRKGRRPSWHAAAPRPVSEPMLNAFVAALRDRGAHVETGVFGAQMELTLVNTGPMTVIVDG